MATLDWSQCPVVESVPGKVSGAWVLKGTRMPVSVIFEWPQLRPHVQRVVEAINSAAHGSYVEVDIPSS